MAITRNSRTGFTLIEIITVIAIIGVLAALLLPALRTAREASKGSVCASNLRQVGMAFNFYLSRNDEIFPCAQDPVSATPFYWLWMGRGWREAVAPYLDPTITRKNPSVLFCPSDAEAKSKFEGTSYAYSLSFYHSPEQVDAMKQVSDSYSNAAPVKPQHLAKVRYPDAKILCGEWKSNHFPAKGDNGWWCNLGERNFLFVDGHVKSVGAKSVLPANDGLPDPNVTVHGTQGRDVP